MAAALLLAVTPGPGIFCSLAGGKREGVLSLGTFVGGLFHVFAAALGLSAILAASAVAFHTIKYAGAAYLIWLGIRMIRSRNAEMTVEAARPSNGLFVKASLPKRCIQKPRCSFSPSSRNSLPGPRPRLCSIRPARLDLRQPQYCRRPRGR